MVNWLDIFFCTVMILKLPTPLVQRKIFINFTSTFLKLPRYLQSNLNNIHILALVKSSLLSKYGVDTMLHQFIEDMKEVCEKRLQLDCPDYRGIVRTQLFQVIGDNLGIHSMLGYCGSFTANLYCRFCKIHRNIAQTLVQEDSRVSRNKHTYEADVAQLDLSATGVARS